MQRTCFLQLLLQFGVAEKEGAAGDQDGGGYDWAPLAARAHGKQLADVAKVGPWWCLTNACMALTVGPHSS